MNVSNLREKIKALPNLPPKADRHTWLRRRIEIRKDILRKDPTEFLGWATIMGCMFVGNAPYTDYEFSSLVSGRDRDRWIDAMVEPGFGSPEMYKNEYVETTGNLIHQAYMVKLLELGTGIKIEDLRSIVEYGGGYGAMAYVASRLGFVGDYTIYDLPEFSILQEYYLGNVGLHDVNCVTIPPVIPYDLMIALWSISETPIEGRDLFVEAVDPSSILATYMPHWEGANNWKWFTDLGNAYTYVADEPLSYMNASSRIFMAYDL